VTRSWRGPQLKRSTGTNLPLPFTFYNNDDGGGDDDDMQHKRMEVSH
jgi:hypothetical protein